MSNPTTPFSWQMPTATDLVTDLPADFEVFGQAVATSMADLLGGTSGQILAKNSNTDMDFTWITNDVGDITAVTAGTGISGGGTSGAVTITNSMATAIDAKGDLIAGTAADTFSRLAVGTNGQTLVADSTASTGLKWATPASATTAFALLATQSITTGSSYSITGLSGYNTLFVVLASLSSTAGGTNYAITLNSDTGSNYNIGGSGFASTAPQAYDGTDTKINLGTQGSNVANAFSGSVQILGCNGTNQKVGIAVGGGQGTSSTQRFGGFAYSGTSVISSVQVTTSGTFDTGTVYIYGSVA